MSQLLIVDDDRDVAEALSSVLEDEGHVVLIADNGEDGLERITAATPDAVLLDVEMPILDGPAMVHRLSVRDSGDEQIPIVLLSGVADLEQIARRVGTPYYLAKPYGITAIAELVKRVLAERQAPVPQTRAPA